MKVSVVGDKMLGGNFGQRIIPFELFGDQLRCGPLVVEERDIDRFEIQVDHKHMEDILAGGE